MSLKSYLRKHPYLFDRYTKWQRRFGKKRTSYDFFNTFSKNLGRPAVIIQIGANDGLRNDPIREFIVRDRWTGILVEPLPTVFEQLKRNYAYCDNSRLIFENAAISNSASHLDFWTFNEAFLNSFPLEQKMRFLRKSSFDKNHLQKFIPQGRNIEEIVSRIEVPCISLRNLVLKHQLQNQIDLFVIDAEGHETVIIPSIDFSVMRPKAIFFEFDHLGAEKEKIYQFLRNNGYTVKEIETDAVGILQN